MGNVDGKVVFEAVLDASGMKQGLEKLNKETSTAVGKWKVGFLAAGAAVAAVGAAAIKVGKAAIDAYAVHEQLVGGVETLFKDSADTVKEYADEAYKAAGMSANAYRETVTGFSASLLQSLAGDTQQAAELGNQTVIDMADNANKMGTDISHIQDAYQGFAKQNYTMLDNLKLGYGGTKSEMERLLADANKLNAEMGILTDYDINSFADIVEAIHVVQESMGIAGTTAAEAEGTIQGSMAAAKAAWENLLVGMVDGTQDIDVLMGNMIDSIIVAAENLIPRIGQVVASLIEMCWTYAPKIYKLLFDLAVDLGKNIIAGLWNGIKGAWGNFIKHFEGKTDELIASAKKDLDIHSPSGVFAEIGEYCMEGLAIGMQDTSGKVIKTQTALSKAIISYAKQGAEELRKTNKATAADEATFWQDLAKSGRLSARELSQAKVLAAKATAEASKDSYEASKDWLDKQVNSNRLSAGELVRAWQRVVDRGNLLSEEQQEAVQQLLKAQKSLREEVNKLEEDYKAAVSARANEIMGSFGLFSAAPTVDEVSAEDLLGNIRSQQDVMDSWCAEIASLAARGLDEGFVAAVREKGPDALGELLALNSMNDEQLQAYADMWQGLNEQAGLAATAELSGLREETDRQIAELLGGVEEQFNEDSPEIGRALSDGLREGILDGKSGVISAATTVAAEAVTAAKRALDINSPSKRFRYLGQMTDEGFISGIQDGVRDVKAAVGEMLSAGVSMTPIAATTIGATAPMNGTTREIITNNRTVEKVVGIKAKGISGELVRALGLELDREDWRIGASLGN